MLKQSESLFPMGKSEVRLLEIELDIPVPQSYL